MAQNRSIWQTTTPPKGVAAPIRSEPIRTEVAIVGGGIAGLTTALLLNKQKRVVLLEAREIGFGTTGNSTGNLYVTVDEHLSKLRHNWGMEVVAQVVESRRNALDFLTGLAGNLRLDCDLIAANFCHYAENDQSAAMSFLEEEAHLFHELGLEPRRDAVSGLPFPVKACLSIPGQAQLHPLKYLRSMAAACVNCEVLEHCPVVGFDEKVGILHCPAGLEVHADVVVWATHTPKGVHLLHTVLGPVREFGVAARLRQPDLPPGIYWRADSPKRSLRAYLAGADSYAMVIGEPCKTGQDQNPRQALAELEQYLQHHLPVAQITHHWSAQAYRAADGLPYIGLWDERNYVMTGFATDGLVYGTLAGMMVSDLILRGKTPWSELYKPTRFTPAKSAAEFFKENADNLIQYLKDVPSGNVSSLDEIPREQGRVLWHGDEKLAVYRDAAGALQAVSAVCTHMKCIVRWNEVEKSWDCPCHGSRFAPDGQVLEGPAIANLERKEL